MKLLKQVRFNVFVFTALKVLNDAKAQYVVVGGPATVLHGYARLTADIDLVINLEQHEAEKAIMAILACGLKPRLPVNPMQFTDKATREGWINDKNMLVFSFYQPDHPLMILGVFCTRTFPVQGNGTTCRTDGFGRDRHSGLCY